jgi:hypothetical protein
MCDDFGPRCGLQGHGAGHNHSFKLLCGGELQEPHLGRALTAPAAHWLYIVHLVGVRYVRVQLLEACRGSQQAALRCHRCGALP